MAQLDDAVKAGQGQAAVEHILDELRAARTLAKEVERETAEDVPSPFQAVPAEGATFDGAITARTRSTSASRRPAPDAEGTAADESSKARRLEAKQEEDLNDDSMRDSVPGVALPVGHGEAAAATATLTR